MLLLFITMLQLVCWISKLLFAENTTIKENYKTLQCYVTSGGHLEIFQKAGAYK